MIKNIIRIIRNNVFMLKIIQKFCPRHITFVLVSSILSSMIPVVNLMYVQYVISAMETNKSINHLLFVIIGMFMLNTLNTFINLYIHKRIIPRNTNILNKEMQLFIFDKIDKLDYSQFEDTVFYNKLASAAQQSDARALEVLNTFSTLIGNFFGIGSLIALIGSLDFFILGIVIINVIINIILNFKSVKLQHNYYLSKIDLERESGYFQRLFYYIEYAKEMKMYIGFSELLKNKFSFIYTKLVDLLEKYSKKQIVFMNLGLLANNIVDTSITIYLVLKALLRLITISDFVTLTNGASQLSGKVVQLAHVLPDFFEHSIYTEDLKTFLELPVKSNEERLNRKLREISTISLNDVSFKYQGSSKYSLKNISLNITSKQKIAIVGRNGAGKSTLIKVLCGLYNDYSGSILLNNININEFTDKDIRDMIGVVFQDYKIYSLTIFENILMRPMLNEGDNEIVNDALKYVGLYDKVMKLQNKTNTVIGREFDENGIFLSGGELQKIIIARIFVKKPKIIILDEPSSSLDSIAEKNLFDTILKMQVFNIIIFITHKLSNITDVDCIFFMKDGTISEIGNHDDLMKNNSDYAKLYNMQALSFK